MDTGFLLGVMKLVVMIVQLCENTINHWTVHFKRVNFMACELYLRKYSIHGTNGNLNNDLLLDNIINLYIKKYLFFEIHSQKFTDEIRC